MRYAGLRRVVLLAGVVLGARPAAAGAGHSEAPKRIMVLYWYNKDYPGNVLFDQKFRAVLDSTKSGTVEYYPEYLETDRFPGEEQSIALRDYLRKKYAGTRLDVVIASAFAPKDFLFKNRTELFPRTPVVCVGPEPPTAKELADESGTTGIVIWDSHRQTLDLALRLHPETEHVFIVSGTIERDKRFEILFRNKLAGYQTRAQIDFLTDLPPNELIVRIKTLPPRSIVLYLWQQSKDEQGRLFESPDILALIAQSTSVPIYGLAGRNIGRGIIGGYVFSIEDLGTRAAQIALEIAGGARAQDIPIESAPTVPMFDWRQLQRWKISENSLPPGSVVKFRDPSLWASHRGEIIGICLFCLVETLLICGLLIQRAQRRRVKGQLHASHSRIQELVGQLLTAQETERARIARDLHDDVSQSLAAVSINIRNLMNRRQRLSDADMQKALGSIERLSIEIGDTVRALSHNLHPPALHHAGLIAAIESLCEEFQERNALTVKCHIEDGFDSVSPEIALCFYRITQEALRNSCKHSRANRAYVALTRNDATLQLTVTDDGQGFDLSAMREDAHGLGLISIEERARFINGTVDILTAPGAGVTVLVRVPVPQTAPQPAHEV